MFTVAFVAAPGRCGGRKSYFNLRSGILNMALKKYTYGG